MMMNAKETKIPFSIKNIAYDKVKAKTASQYLGVNNIQFKRDFHPKTPQHILVNMQIISFLSRDIFMDIDWFVKMKYIPAFNSINILKDISKDEERWVKEEYERQGKNEDVYNDNYIKITDYFRNLSSRLLSDFQKEADEELESMLYCLLAIRYIHSNLKYTITSPNQGIQTTLLNKLIGISNQIQLQFLQRHSKVSNSTIDLSIYDELFDKMRRMDAEKLTELILQK
ncbi:hypothetical protein HZP59_09115 [Elizabethkingia anophelis]|nr:hypothetical protein [Elizabethkingia anophelis]